MSDIMKRRSFLGFLGTTIGIYAAEPTTIAWTPADIASAPDVATASSPSRMQSFVLRNDGTTPMVVAYKSLSADAPPLSSAARALEKVRYQAEAILLPGEELTITATPMKGLSPLTDEDKRAMLHDGGKS